MATSHKLGVVEAFVHMQLNGVGLVLALQCDLDCKLYSSHIQFACITYLDGRRCFWTKVFWLYQTLLSQ